MTHACIVNYSCDTQNHSRTLGFSPPLQTRKLAFRELKSFGSQLYRNLSCWGAGIYGFTHLCIPGPCTMVGTSQIFAKWWWINEWSSLTYYGSRLETTRTVILSLLAGEEGIHKFFEKWNSTHWFYSSPWKYTCAHTKLHIQFQGTPGPLEPNRVSPVTEYLWVEGPQDSTGALWVCLRYEHSSIWQLAAGATTGYLFSFSNMDKGSWQNFLGPLGGSVGWF